MTSEVLRKLLVAGAAVAALSVAACQKPAAPTDNAATADANAPAASAMASDANAPATNAMATDANAPAANAPAAAGAMTANAPAS